MKLATAIALHGGGPGSGCHGDNCGRPPGSGSQVREHANTDREEKLREMERKMEERLSNKKLPSYHPNIKQLRPTDKSELKNWGNKVNKWWKPPYDPVKRERADDAADVALSIATAEQGEAFGVHDSQGRLLGAMNLIDLPKATAVEIAHLAVSPEVILGKVKSSGTGTKLMVQAAKYAAARNKGITLVALEGARTFYEKLGMKERHTNTYSWTAEDCKAIAKGTEHWS